MREVEQSTRRSSPVSYTHLDVYKRQELEPPAPIKLDTAYDFPITSLDLSRYDDKYGVVAQ